MKKLLKLSMNQVFGLLVGFGAAVIMNSLCDTFLIYFQSSQYNLNYGVLYVSKYVLSLLIFLLIFRLSLRMKVKKLSIYLILAMIAAMGGAILVWILAIDVIRNIFDVTSMQNLIQSDEGVLFMIGGIYSFFALILLVFNFIFMRLINRKVKYITYISNEVTRIKEEGVGLQIQERGDDELTILTQGINSMSKKLLEDEEHEKKMEQEKNELITNVSHDLRTPLTSVIGYVQLLKENEFKDKERFDEYIEVVERRVNGLKLLIDELFEYTKLTSTDQGMECKKVDVIPLMLHLLNEYEIIYQKENLQLEQSFMSSCCFLEIDQNKIVRVLQNLLDNARKYAKKDTTVMVKVSETNDWFQFEIQNQVSERNFIDVNRLFERFYMADSSRSKADSSGLGLAIVKRIVELHGGELSAHLEDGMISFCMKLVKGSDTMLSGLC